MQSDDSLAPMAFNMSFRASVLPLQAGPMCRPVYRTLDQRVITILEMCSFG